VTQTVQAQLDQPLLDLEGVDLGQATRLTYVLLQRFRYDYEGHAYALHHRLVVIPRTSRGSVRLHVRQVEVSAPDAQVATRRDTHGNQVTTVRLEVVPPSVEFRVAAVVERSLSETGPLLPAEALKDPRLLRPTALTTADQALRQLAGELRASAPDDLDFAQLCCERVKAAITYEFGVTSTSTTAAQAYAGGRGVCQDHAHVMLSLCHAAGVPARYVSGHLLGEGGTHAWVEVLVLEGPFARAVAFDPCNGVRAGAHHLTVATGRDYRDVAPTSGSFRGNARGRLTTTKHLGIIAAA
jgi:transglutaminase-like putative cysteine protease